MFVIFYNKQSLEVVGFRGDSSTNPSTAEEAFKRYLIDENKTQVDINYVELAFQNIMLDKGKYLYNSATNSVDVNPSYVAPVPTPEPTEPTA